MKPKYNRRILPDRRVASDILLYNDNHRTIVSRSGIDRRRHPDDQRWHMRYKAKSGLFVIFRRPARFKLWKSYRVYAASIIDISLKGIRAQYTASNMWPYDVDTLSIATADENVLIDSVPYKLISDRIAMTAPNTGNLRRIGIKFVNLSDHHIWQLLSILQNYTQHPISYNQR